MKISPAEAMRLAVREALKTPDSRNGENPRVGAVIVSERGCLIAAAHRSEIKLKEHAEYTLLTRKLGDRYVEGSTLYTTLEPCTKRSPSKSGCVFHILQRRVGCVVIGMLDPNPLIFERGKNFLLRNEVDVGFFEEEETREIAKMNEEFIAKHGKAGQKVVKLGLGRVNYPTSFRTLLLPDGYRQVTAACCELEKVGGAPDRGASGEAVRQMSAAIDFAEAVFKRCGATKVQVIGVAVYAEFADGHEHRAVAACVVLQRALLNSRREENSGLCCRIGLATGLAFTENGDTAIELSLATAQTLARHARVNGVLVTHDTLVGLDRGEVVKFLWYAVGRELRVRKRLFGAIHKRTIRATGARIAYQELHWQ